MERRKRINKLRVIIFIILIVIIMGTLVNKYKHIFLDKISNIYNNNYFEKTVNIDELANNSLYLGIGQETVEGKDGYDTTFTTSNGKVYKEYKQNGNSSWKNNFYWGGTVEENGCGLAAISTLLSAYNMNYTPEDLRKIYVNFEGNHIEGNQMSDELTNRFGISNTDFYYADTYFKKNYVMKHLEKDKPVLICVWNKPDSKWTTASHYMLLLATDGKDKVYVSNPNRPLW